MSGARNPPDPLIRELPPEPTDQRIAGTGPDPQGRGREIASGRSHLYNWIGDDISNDRRDRRFRRVKENPIDPTGT